MAIVKMRKLNLIAMSYDKDVVLNALQRTGAVEVTLHAETEYTTIPEVNAEGLQTYVSSVDAALSALATAIDAYEKDNGIKTGGIKDAFDVTYSDFMSAKDKRAEADATIENIYALIDEKNKITAELGRLAREKETAFIYANVNVPFHAFAHTVHTKARLGVVPALALDNVKNALDGIELCAYQVVNQTAENVLLFVSSHKSITNDVDGVLGSFGFADCPYSGEKTGEDIYRELVEQEKQAKHVLKENANATYAMRDKLRDLKIYSDYLSFVLEKEEVGSKLRVTQRTFLLQAYVPYDMEEQVREALTQSVKTAYFEFSDPTEEETPPTLLKNNKLIESFEGITNTYSAPNYREFDPNTVMAFFYSLFMGFIIGDAGYGLLMAAVGGWLWWKNLKRPTGLSRLAGAFAVGGVFAMIWGALFNSFFGFALLPKTIMPNPQTDQWSLASIPVPSVLIITMLLGVVQIFAGYICKAVQMWRRGDIVGGICEGIFWAFFSVGVGLAIVGFVKESNMPNLAVVGGITAGVSLVLAMLTAGRNEKFFGKFTKGFGAAYGVINYASDILSYARLYGLMLSGAVIAQIIATYSWEFLISGNVALILLAVVLLIIGNAFNLVMNLLGAYIHDARLQYVEFYGKFFEGEGELFAPLGSSHKYVYVLPENGSVASSKV